MKSYGFTQCGEMFQPLPEPETRVEVYGNRKVEFSEDVPPFLFRHVLPVVRRHVNLIPHWCDQLTILWRPEGNEDPELGTERPLECRPVTRYRRALVWVTPAAAGLSSQNRTEGILHELMHLQLAPLMRLVETEGAELDNQPKVCRLMTDRLEQTIQSLVQAYLMKNKAGESFEATQELL